MNNRDYKQFAAGEFYHVYNRGTGKMDIFREAGDYRLLRTRLEEYLYPKTMGTIASRPRRKTFPENAFTLVCYCLMPNHFHFLIRQNKEVPISALMLNLWSGYSKYFNKKYDRVGSLFQDQFKAVLVDSDNYLKWLSAYIHQNPSVARLVERPDDYSYSSYREYIDSGNTGLCAKDIVLGQFKNIREYRDFVDDSLEQIQERKELENLFID